MSKKKKRKNKSEKNNCCINYSLVSEVIANYGADTFWLASLVDTLSYWSLSPIEILGISAGVSIPALTIGSILALLSSLGYASSRKDVNLKINQSEQDEVSEEGYGSTTNDKENGDIESGDADNETQNLNETSGGLSWWQYLKLAGHLISTAGDVAAMPVAIFTLLNMKVALPRTANFLVHCAATLWGTTAAIAPTNACAKAMKSLNKNPMKS